MDDTDVGDTLTDAAKDMSKKISRVKNLGQLVPTATEDKLDKLKKVKFRGKFTERSRKIW